MSKNKEKKFFDEKVHLYLALERPSKSGGKRACIRHVIRDPKE
jgi:hypothetical protein